MVRSKQIAGLLTGLLVAVSGARAVTQVNGETLPEKAVDYMAEVRMERDGAPNRLVVERQARDELVARLVVAQQAREQGLDQREDVIAQNYVNELAVLSQAYLQQYRESLTVTEAQIEAEYDLFKEQNKDLEYKVSHIVTVKEEEALRVVSALNRGDDFTELAKENSIEPSVEETGGQLGWMRPAQFPDRPFADAVAALKAGEFTQQPIKTDYGWHVIRVEDGPRPLKFPPLDQASEEFLDGLRDSATQKLVDAHVRKLIDAADISH